MAPNAAVNDSVFMTSALIGNRTLPVSRNSRINVVTTINVITTGSLEDIPFTLSRFCCAIPPNSTGCRRGNLFERRELSLAGCRNRVQCAEYAQVGGISVGGRAIRIRSDPSPADIGACGGADSSDVGDAGKARGVMFDGGRCSGPGRKYHPNRTRNVLRELVT